MDALTARAQQDWEDYREVFFATGGTQEQWDEQEMDESSTRDQIPVGKRGLLYCGLRRGLGHCRPGAVLL